MPATENPGSQELRPLSDPVSWKMNREAAPWAVTATSALISHRVDCVQPTTHPEQPSWLTGCFVPCRSCPSWFQMDWTGKLSLWSDQFGDVCFGNNWSFFPPITLTKFIQRFRSLEYFSACCRIRLVKGKRHKTRTPYTVHRTAYIVHHSSKEVCTCIKEFRSSHIIQHWQRSFRRAAWGKDRTVRWRGVERKRGRTGSQPLSRPARFARAAQYNIAAT